MMSFFKRKFDKPKSVVPALGLSQAAAGASAVASRNVPVSPDALNGDIGLASNPLGSRPVKMVLSEDSLFPSGEQTSYPCSPLKTSSRLSKTLLEILHDKDALHCFIHFLESKQADKFVRFWLDANSFRATTLTRMHTHSLQSVNHSLLLKRRTQRKDQSEHERFELDPTVHDESSISLSLTATQAENILSEECATKFEDVHTYISSESVFQPGDTCPNVGSPDSDSSIQSQRANLSVEILTSKDTFWHKTDISHDPKVETLRSKDIQAPDIDPEAVISMQGVKNGDDKSIDTLTDTIHQDVNKLCTDVSERCDTDSVAAQSVIQSGNRNLYAEQGSNSSKLALSSIAQEIKDKLTKSIEHDAVGIFTKYIAKDAPQPIGVDDSLRGETIRKICREDGQVDPDCFVVCQEFVVQVMEKEYYPSFMDSTFHCKHQLNVLTSGKVYLADILYNELALCYLTEFMEQEGAIHLMQFWMATDNFQQQLVQQGGHYDGMQAQTDAMVLYDKYFSLQATTPLGFNDKIRFEVESNICQENGPQPDCFSKPQTMVMQMLDKQYFPRYLQGDIYYRYLSDLINTVQMAQDLPIKKHKREASDASSEHSGGSQSTGVDSVSIKNTLLASGSRTARGKSVSPPSLPEKMEEHFTTMDTDFSNPDKLWARANKGSLSLGKVNEFGQFVSEFDPDPDQKKKKGGGFFKKKKNKEKEQEEMALRVAQMILSDVTTMTQTGDAYIHSVNKYTYNPLSAPTTSFFEPPPS